MLFEIGKLTATLAVGTTVAISAVTPALLPTIGTLKGLWPSFAWLLVSIVVSVIFCLFSMSNVSQLLANIEKTKERRLPSWVSKVVKALPYALLINFSVGALLIGIGKFALFISANL